MPIVVSEYQISGKTSKYVDKESGIYYKRLNSRELRFYEYASSLQIGDPNYSIVRHIPHFLGVNRLKNEALVYEEKQGCKSDKAEWIRHLRERKNQDGDYLMMRDILGRFMCPNIVDIKLGKQKKSATNKHKSSTNSSKYFKINGMLVNLRKSNQEKEIIEEKFMNKYYFQKMAPQGLQSHLALIFYDGATIFRPLLEAVIAKLKELFLDLKCTDFLIISSSLFIAIDLQKGIFDVKVIDFENSCLDAHKCPSVGEGIINLHACLCKILEDLDFHEKVLQQGELQCLKSFKNQIPKEVVQKYKTMRLAQPNDLMMQKQLPKPKYSDLLSKKELGFLEYQMLVESDEFEYVYKPNDDTFLLLSVLKQEINTFPKDCCLLELGSGSGIISAHMSRWLKEMNNPVLLHISIDINMDASQLSSKYYEHYDCPILQINTSLFKNTLLSRLQPEVIVFNPPYVAVEQEQIENEQKYLRSKIINVAQTGKCIRSKEMNMIAFSYMGGLDGLAVTRKFIQGLNWSCRAYFIVMGKEGLRTIERETKNKAILSHPGVNTDLEILAFHQFYNEELFVLKLTVKV